jgi:hypothetical protein
MNNTYVVIFVLIAFVLSLLSRSYLLNKSRLERRVFGMILMVAAFFITVVLVGMLGI